MVTISRCTEIIVRRLNSLLSSKYIQVWGLMVFVRLSMTKSHAALKTTSVGGSSCLAVAPSSCTSGVIQWNYPNYANQKNGICAFRFQPSSQCYKIVMNARFDTSSANPLAYSVAGNLEMHIDSNYPITVRGAFVDGPYINVFAYYNGSVVYAENVDYYITPVSCNALPIGIPSQPQPTASPTAGPMCPAAFSQQLNGQHCALSVSGAYACANAYWDDPASLGKCVLDYHFVGASTCFYATFTAHLDVSNAAYYDRSGVAHVVFDVAQPMKSVALPVRGPYASLQLDYAGSWVSALGFNVTFKAVDCSNLPSSVPQQMYATYAQYTYYTSPWLTTTSGILAGTTDVVTDATTDTSDTAASTTDLPDDTATSTSAASYSSSSRMGATTGATTFKTIVGTKTAPTHATVATTDTDETTIFPNYFPSVPWWPTSGTPSASSGRNSDVTTGASSQVNTHSNTNVPPSALSDRTSLSKVTLATTRKTSAATWMARSELASAAAAGTGMLVGLVVGPLVVIFLACAGER
jgi:hypothetical protein